MTGVVVAWGLRGQAGSQYLLDIHYNTVSGELRGQCTVHLNSLRVWPLNLRMKRQTNQKYSLIAKSVYIFILISYLHLLIHKNRLMPVCVHWKWKAVYLWETNQYLRRYKFIHDNSSSSEKSIPSHIHQHIYLEPFLLVNSTWSVHISPIISQDDWIKQYYE